jgi:formate hydrogenlyase subunit 3/multisubunit Na+/H+ antiporter MnhD subunit
MDILEMLRQAGVVALLSLAIDFVPLVMAVAYVVRPSERRLALMRPLSLAGLFSALCGTTVGFVNVLRGIAISSEPFDEVYHRTAAGASEALVTTFVGFACLTAAWLLVAVGMSRSRPELG